MSGTRQPRYSTGRVYWGNSRRPLERAVVGGALVVAEDAGEQADDGVGDDGGGEGAIGEDVVADGDFVVDEVVDDALVDAFVMAAEEDEVRDLGEILGGALGEAAAAGGGGVRDSIGVAGMSESLSSLCEVARRRRRWVRIS